ncbi:hypothetical protein ACGFIY_32640 [Micromonospora chersina]|uniref:hypothetical protein n=1 Tax=Micromonospora chersina TaxID=47854 RepID=UPI0037192694
MTHRLADLLDIARIADQLGTRVLETTVVRQVTTKGPKGVVTDLDPSIEQQILTFLKERTPDTGRYSQEAGGDPARPANDGSSTRSTAPSSSSRACRSMGSPSPSPMASSRCSA